MPAAVTGTISADAVMAKVETTVKPNVLETFKKDHPAKFWLCDDGQQPCSWYFAARRKSIPS